jgi:hypothetical protein
MAIPGREMGRGALSGLPLWGGVRRWRYRHPVPSELHPKVSLHAAYAFTNAALRRYFTSESPEVCDRLAGWIAEYVIERAIDGHFGYFKLVLDLVDGKLHRTAETEWTFES